jgi:hypothetical protein
VVAPQALLEVAVGDARHEDGEPVGLVLLDGLRHLRLDGGGDLGFFGDLLELALLARHVGGLPLGERFAYRQ